MPNGSDSPSSTSSGVGSAAASIALHLRRNSYKIRLVTGDGVDVDATERDGEGIVLDTMAEVTTSASADWTRSVSSPTLPEPMYVPASTFWRFWVIVPTTFPPASMRRRRRR